MKQLKLPKRLVLIAGFLSLLFVLGTLTTRTSVDQVPEDNYEDVLEDLNPLKVKVLFPSIAEEYKTYLETLKPIDWHNYAYVNYISEVEYLCYSYAQFKTLLKLGSKAKFVILATPNVMESPQVLKIKALSPKQFMIKRVEERKVHDESRWSNSLVKLEVLNLIEFKRIIFMDSDAIIQHALDELFLLPDNIEFVAPVSYWESSVSYPTQIDSMVHEKISKGLDFTTYLPELIIKEFDPPKGIADREWIKNARCKARWTSILMAIRPSEKLYKNVISLVDGVPGRYDMEYINDYFDFKKIIAAQQRELQNSPKKYKPTVLALSMEYSTLSNHVLIDEIANYITQGKPPSQAIKQFKFIHFSDMFKPHTVESSFGLQCPAPKNLERLCGTWSSWYSKTIQLLNQCRT